MEQLRRDPVDLLITDLLMPGVDGIELIRATRTAGGKRALKIIAVSASASEYTSQQALDAGGDAFLPKPLHLVHLLDRIADLLGIQWRYADDTTPSRQPATAVGAFTLQPDLQGELYHLALLGDIAGLVERATERLGADPSACGFCDELKALASEYDTGAIRRMLSARSAG